jgi:putative transposase
MATVDELLDALLKDCKKPEDVVGENALLKQLTKRVLERAMQAEMADHHGYEKHSPDGNNSGNSRNGTYKKTVKGEFGTLDVTVPRDPNGTIEPVILPKGQSRFTGFGDKIISLYARGMTTRDVQSHLQEMYGLTFRQRWFSRLPMRLQMK